MNGVGRIVRRAHRERTSLVLVAVCLAGLAGCAEARCETDLGLVVELRGPQAPVPGDPVRVAYAVIHRSGEPADAVIVTARSALGLHHRRRHAPGPGFERPVEGALELERSPGLGDLCVTVVAQTTRRRASEDPTPDDNRRCLDLESDVTRGPEKETS